MAWGGWRRSGWGASLVSCSGDGFPPGKQGNSTQLRSLNSWGTEVTLICRFQLAADLDPSSSTTRLSGPHWGHFGAPKAPPIWPFLSNSGGGSAGTSENGRGRVGAWALHLLPTLPLFPKQPSAGKTYPPLCQTPSAHSLRPADGLPLPVLPLPITFFVFSTLLL